MYLASGLGYNVFMYSHTQFGWMTLIALLGGLVALGAVGRNLGPEGTDGLKVGMAVLALMMPLFGWLTVTVDEEAVTARFGIGLLRKKVWLRDIKSAKRVRNKWWYGWGMRMGPWGWMYNVSGLDAVEIELKNGGRFRIGTDEPEELVSAIRSSLFGFGR
jgi:hypothetical protein